MPCHICLLASLRVHCSYLQFAETLALVINLACLIIMWVAAVHAADDPTLGDILSGVFLCLQIVNMVIVIAPVYVGE